MGLNNFSDYGSGSSSESFTPWGSHDAWSEFQSLLQEPDNTRRPRSSSFTDSFSIDAIMQEFRQNGSDSPYDPEDETLININSRALGGMGPSNAYLRQKSWPAPEASPSVCLQQPAEVKRRAADIMLSVTPAEVPSTPEPSPAWDSYVISEQQLRVLSSLPNSVLYALLKELEQNRLQHAKPSKQNVSILQDMECRFCKNNGERESYYRSHRLRVRGRLACPVLRAYRCRRCGARGDHAHTLKYCPLATADERMQSAAMLRSVRLASGRRRAAPAARDSLDPLWEALERKLML
ncbi:nanos homolog 1-like [Vanessa cardui]|uniref:nanos homolog 1-like n=1 Tax=Vanessa cardui TaxID=171605 RepID=UPI001F13C7A9|nr:nanos homolog 1-like [Vanessa cardui]